MRLRLNPRAERLLSRIPRPTVVSTLELALLVMIAVQAARLLWILVTPVGPVGDYRGDAGHALFPSTAVLGDFDPFFRLAEAAGPAVVTSLDLKLHGVREDRATGRGSAIIALPDGTQQNFVVGEEIMPGVTLAQVGFDNVSISRNGALEQIFLDQSTPAQPGVPTPAQSGAPNPAPTVQPPAPASPPPASPPAPAAAPAGQPLAFQPRVNGDRIDGIAVAVGADGGQAFRAAGFAAGDVIVSVNGQQVTSMGQARAALGSGGSAIVVVDRAGRRVPLSVRLSL